MSELIHAELRPTPFYRRWACLTCGAAAEKTSVICAIAEDHPQHGRRVICSECLGGNIDTRLADFAADLEGQAAQLRGLIGRIAVPPHSAWAAAEAAANAEFAAELQAAEVPADAEEGPL
jgi:hypothetical protein